jgi:hypothetical protein
MLGHSWSWFGPALIGGLRTLPEAVLWLVLLVGPGLWLALAMARRTRLDLAEIGALSFAGTLALASLSGMAAYYLGLALDAVTAVLALGALASIASLIVMARGRWTAVPHRIGAWGLGIAGVAALLSAASGPWLIETADTLYHLAAIRTLVLMDQPLVTDPFLGTSSHLIDPTAGSLHTLLASLTRVLGGDVLVHYDAINVAAAALFALLAWAVFRVVTKRAWPAAVATGLFLFVALHADTRAFLYPHTLSVPLAFLGLALLGRAVHDRGRVLAGAAVLTGVAACDMHLGAAQLFAIGAAVVVAWAAVGALVEWRRRGGRAREAVRGLARVAAITLVTALLVAPVVLPRALSLPRTTTLGGAVGPTFQMPPTAVASTGMRYVPVQAVLGGDAVVYVPWIALIAAAAYIGYKRRDGRALAAAMLASLSVVTLADPFVSAALLHVSPFMVTRLLTVMAICPYIAIAWGLSMPIKAQWRGVVPALAIVAAAALLLGGTFQALRTYTSPDALSIPWSRQHDVRVLWGPDIGAKLTKLLDSSRPMLVGDPSTLYMLAGLSSVRIAAAPYGHSPLWSEGQRGLVARDDMTLVTHSVTPASEVRAMVDKYGAGFIAFGPAPASETTLTETLVREGYPVALRSGTLVILRVPSPR